MIIKCSRVALQAALVALGYFAVNVNAMSPNPNPYDVTLVDGSVVSLHLEGSEDDPHEEDEQGYSVIAKDNNGKDYEYAEKDNATGDLKPSGIKVNDPEKKKKLKQKGIGKGLQRSEKAKQDMGKGGLGSTFLPKEKGSNGKKPDRRLSHIDDYETWDESVEDFHRRQLAMDWSGPKKNLVIPFMFSNHHNNGVANRWLPSTAELDILFNSDATDSNYAPTGSVKKVFTDTSYGKVTLDSDVVDWIPLDYTESYYANGNRGFTTVMHQAMRHALNKLEATGFDFSPYDSDNDGLIDAVCFLHSGYAAEWGGTAEDGATYLNRIWSHKWSLYSFRHPSTASGSGWTSNPATSSGKAVRIYNYHISPAVYGTYPTGKAINQKMGRIGVIAHETGHFMGITDLYDTSGDAGNGAGSWGLMANSWGFTNDQFYPPIMNPWSKMELNWLTPTEITSSGTYNMRDSYSTEEVFKVSSGFADDEYLLIEYRKSTGFEQKIGYPSSMDGGLAIWHIDNKAGYSTQGWPGQTGWPANGKHYRISLLQADGDYDLEKNVNRGDKGDLFEPGVVTGIGPSGTSAGKAYPNTDSYQGGNIVPSGVSISGISWKQGKNKIEFDIVVPTVVQPTPAPVAPTNPPTASPTKSPTASPTKAPTVPPTKSPTRAPVVSQLTCTGADRLFTLTLDAPAKASDLSWIVDDVAKAQARVHSPEYADTAEPTQYIHEYCLPQAGCYMFDLYDASGSGVSHVAAYDGQLVADSNGSKAFSVNGGDFGSSCILSSSGRTADNIPSTSGAPKANGIMFDLQANVDMDLVLFRFTTLHLATGTHTVKIYTKNGSYKGYEGNEAAWTLVQTLTGLVGAGIGGVTLTGSNISPFVPILEETTQAFYIVVDSESLHYSAAPAAEGDLTESFAKFNLFAGAACSSSTPFIGCNSGTVAGFEGRIHTGFVEVYSTHAPTEAPVVATPTEAPVPSPTKAPVASSLTCTGADRKFSLTLDAPAKASDLSWIIDDVAKAQARVHSPSYADAAEPAQYIHEYCLPQDGCYMFDLYDASGNGVSHVATYDGELVAESSGSNAFSVNGGDFGASCNLAAAGRTADNIPSTSGAPKANGIMFDLQANADMDLVMFRFTTLHLATGTHTVKLYTKNGSYKGYEENEAAWTLIQTLTGLDGAGVGGVTLTGTNVSPFVPILEETTQAFYIVLDSESLHYSSSPAAEGDLTESFAKFNLFAGAACSSSTPFAGCNSGVVAGFEGRIHTGFVEVYSTHAPTEAPVAAPVGSPVEAPAPTETPIVCSAGEKKLTIELYTDENADELSWEVVNVYNNGAVAGTGGSYPAGASSYIREELCLSNSACYRFNIRDSAGDGIAGTGNGVKVTYDGMVEMEPVVGYNPSFAVDGVDFGGTCLPSGGALVTMGLSGSNVAHGNMFDMKAVNDIMIRRFSFLHIADTGTYGYKVYTKNGSYRGYESDASKWTLVHDGTITGSGAGAYTTGDNFSAGTVPVLSGTTQAFYVVLDQPKLQYFDSAASVEGEDYITFGDLVLKTGIAKGADFASASSGTACIDGKITYAPARINTAGSESFTDEELDNEIPDDQLVEDFGKVDNPDVEVDK